MINNDLGFTLAEGLPFTAYDKVIEGSKNFLLYQHHSFVPSV